jgi:hypothetical protein
VSTDGRPSLGALFIPDLPLHHADAVPDHEAGGGLLATAAANAARANGRPAASRYKRYKIADKHVTQNTDRDADGS